MNCLSETEREKENAYVGEQTGEVSDMQLWAVH